MINGINLLTMQRSFYIFNDVCTLSLKKVTVVCNIIKKIVSNFYFCYFIKFF